MGSVGDAYDNAVAESFFATLKGELLDREPWPTRDAARSAVFAYLEGWYNRQRRHSALGYQNPVTWKEMLLLPAPAASRNLSTQTGVGPQRRRCA